MCNILPNWSMGKGNILQWFQEILREREMPDLLKKGIDWLNETTQTDEGAIALGLSLIDGTGTYYDGTTLPIDTWAARNILSYLSIHNPKASYYFGLEKLKGTFGDKNRGAGKMHLISSARCGYVPAMIELAQERANARPMAGCSWRKEVEPTLLMK